ncbi:hypothetical protein DCC39_13165 [Pueribacillus theae]|uniref:histidine kinase n=1 Tax=Pueribacillus theae TaxID=2171751 RepID=A0A2U1JX96_9BACI|nr:ATP-binding protein [Pueribacillus theae]PWA09443.1 hypothetical protein DCC39_13165 [Pueribacillus theae]
MPIKKVIFIVSVFLSILTVFRFVWLNLYTTPNHPHANQGVLDLRNWEQISDSSITLDGEWEFYPNTLLMQRNADPLFPEKGSEFIQVPGNWDFADEASSTYGFGSYRLRILVDQEKGKTYGIRLPNISSSSEVYVNRELIARSGKPGKNRQQYKPLNVPYTTYFTLEEAGEIELVIQVANYDNPRNGGIIRSLKFGLADPLNRDTGFAINVVLVACIIYMLHALYSFIIFLVGNRDRRFLYFSFMIVCVVLGTLIGERLLFAWFPFHFDWSIKVTNLALIAGGYFLLQFIKQQLPDFLRAKLVIPYVTVCGISALVTLFLPASYNLVLTQFYSIVVLIPCILTISVMYRSATWIDKSNILLLLAVISAVYSFIWLLIINVLKIEMISYPFDLMIAMICFATYWFKRYFSTLADSQTMTIQLQEADKRKDDFLVTVAHEMRNPLHGILNISQAVVEREKGTIRKKSVQDLELLITVGRRMSLLLNDLLELERFKENRIAIHPKGVSVHSVAEAVMDMLRFMAHGKTIQLVNRIPSNFPDVFADENRLNQILFNLLYNAVKYSHDGEVSVSAYVQEGWARISIADNGVGIDEEFLDKVFEPYEQASRGAILNDSGIGLGLSICKQLVELHGGILEVSSTLNQGSVFTFTLRLSTPSTQQRDVTSAPTEAGNEQSASAAEAFDGSRDVADENSTSRSIRILAVDDDPVNLKVLESTFSMAPYEIFTATNGQDALSMLDRYKWDIIIADVMMPNMSGYELTSHIRAQYSITELPVLLLTAYNRNEDIEAGFRAGANDYVTKPMNAVELKSRVQSLTKLRRSVSERLRMEAAWLQAQIKPHFIINTFNSIAALGRIDLDRMDALIEELSNYIRLSIDFQNSDGVAPLNDELQLVRSYLFILKERFGDRLHVVWDVDDYIQSDIPPLTIQPLVENAIDHGILKRAKGGEVRIRLKDEGQFIEVSIMDNGEGMDEERLKQLLDRKSGKRSGIGLLNIDRRLKQLYGKGLEIKSKLGEGTTISFKIPKMLN